MNVHLDGVFLPSDPPKSVFLRRNQEFISKKLKNFANVSMQLFRTQKQTKKIETISMLSKQKI